VTHPNSGPDVASRAHVFLNLSRGVAVGFDESVRRAYAVAVRRNGISTVSQRLTPQPPLGPMVRS